MSEQVPVPEERELSHDEWEAVFKNFEQLHEGEKPGAQVEKAVQDLERKKVKDRAAGRKTRNKFSIAAFVGPNGGGKTACMIQGALPFMALGRKQISTVKLLDPWTGNVHPAYERLTDWGQVLNARHADLLFDEVVGIASSRASQGMPIQVANVLNQLRRADVRMRWTAPNWSRADTIIREVTQAVTMCHGYLPQVFVAGEGEAQRQWATKRLFHWVTYDAMDFSEWSDTKTKKLEKMSSNWYWGPSSLVFRSYDTFDSVERVGEVLDGGSCAWCGGSRTRPKCQCGPDAHRHGSIDLATSDK